MTSRPTSLYLRWHVVRFVTGAYQIHETLTKRTYRTHSDTSTMPTHTKPYVCCRQKANLRSVRSTGVSVDHNPPVIIRPSSHGSDGTICTHKIPHPSARSALDHCLACDQKPPLEAQIGVLDADRKPPLSQSHMDSKPQREVPVCRCGSASGRVVDIVLTWWR